MATRLCTEKQIFKTCHFETVDPIFCYFCSISMWKLWWSMCDYVCHVVCRFFCGGGNVQNVVPYPVHENFLACPFLNSHSHFSVLHVSPIQTLAMRLCGYHGGRQHGHHLESACTEETSPRGGGGWVGSTWKVHFQVLTV